MIPCHCRHCGHDISATANQGNSIIACPVCHTQQPGPAPAVKAGHGLTWALVITYAVILALVIGAHLLSPDFRSKPAATQLGFMIGSYLFVWGAALVIALIAGGIAKAAGATFDRTAKITHLIGIVVIGLLFCIGTAFSTLFKSVKSKRMQERAMIEDMQKSLQGAHVDEATGKFVIPELPASAPSDSIFASKIRTITNSSLQDMATIRNRYKQELVDMHFDKVLDAERLKQDIDGTGASKLITSARAAADKAKAEQLKIIETISQRAKSAGLSGNELRGFMDGYSSSLAKGNIEKSWGFEFALLSSIEKLATHLHATRTSWAIMDGRFTFEQDEDLSRFRDLQGELKIAIQAQEAHQKSILESSQQKLQKLKTQLHDK